MRKAIGHRLPSLLVALPLLSAAMAGCSSVDCPLHGTVHGVWTLDGDTLRDTLTVSTTRADGNDSVLLNRLTATTAFALPVSYGNAHDVFFFERADTAGRHAIDTVTVAKDDQPHFEAVDCNPVFFHTITAVTTTHHGIDSIVVAERNVNFDSSHAHFKIHFKSRLR